MANRIVAGLVAGACGTLALNTAAYVDMLVRGRSASRLPADVAGKIAEEIGLPLDFDVDVDSEPDADDADEAHASDTLANRQDALAALMGYSIGLLMGVVYGLMRLVLPRLPTRIAAFALGNLSMAAANFPATRLGLIEPPTWGTTDWLADVLPHMAYGIATAATFEAIKK